MLAVKKDLSEQELHRALSFEIYLNKKRNENERYEKKFDFGNCKICNDEATGLHYGTPSCEGCKGFFKRSIDKHYKYICKANKNCKILPKQTKKCKLCRWNACVKSGMSFSGIRFGRIPNNWKQYKPKVNLDTITSENSMVMRNESRNIVSKIVDKCLHTSYENQIIVLSLLKDKSFQLFREHTKEFDVQEQRALRLIETGQMSVKYDYSKELVQILIEKDLDFLKKHASSMLEIIHELPGFDRLSKQDVHMILNENFFLVLGFRTFKLFINGDYFFMLDDELQLNREGFALIGGEKVRDIIFDFFFSLKSLNLNDQEIGLLIPYFLSSFNVKINDQKLIKEINEYYSRALYYEFSLNKRSIEFLDDFSKTVSVAPKFNKMCRDVNLEIDQFHI